MDPYLQDITFRKKCYAIKTFAAAVRSGRIGGGRQVRSGTVSTALSAVNTTISLELNQQPLKVAGSKDFIPLISVMLKGWEKTDPAVEKKMPVEVDVPEYVVKMGLQPGASEATKATGDSCLFAFYYLLRVGEYTVKGTRNESKQTVQFRIKDVTFFKKDAAGRLRKLPLHASEEDIMSADAATLRLENQKNGWKGVCISHHSNGLEAYDPVRAVGRRYVHIRSHTRDPDTFLSAYFQDGKRQDVRDRDISAALKLAAGALDYPSRGLPIKRIDTHSLRIGGANALSLNGYSKHQIQKMGRWRGETFLEYIRESLSDFSEGMSSAMNKCFGFVSLESGCYNDVTNLVVGAEYNVAVSAASAA